MQITSKKLSDTTFMLYDIEALQYLYGANKSSGASNNIFSFNTDYKGFQTIWSPNGGTIDASAEAYSNIIDLNAGSFSSIGIQGVSKEILDTNSQTIIDWWTYDGLNNVAIAYGSIINIAKGGSGNDAFYLDMNNSDTIYGGAGTDTAYLYVKTGETIEQDYTKTTGTDSGGAYSLYTSKSFSVTFVQKLYDVENVASYNSPLQIHQKTEITAGATVPASLASTVSTFIQSTASLKNTASTTVLPGGDMPILQQNIYNLANPV